MLRNILLLYLGDSNKKNSTVAKDVSEYLRVKCLISSCGEFASLTDTAPVPNASSVPDIDNFRLSPGIRLLPRLLRGSRRHIIAEILTNVYAISI